MNHWSSGRKSCSKNFKTPFFSKYQKFLPWGNSNRSKTSPKCFQNFFSTNTVARGAQSFCILEGAACLLIEQWPKFFCQFSKDMWWTNAENFKKISWLMFEKSPINWKFVSTHGQGLVTFRQNCKKWPILGHLLQQFFS